MTDSPRLVLAALALFASTALGLRAQDEAAPTPLELPSVRYTIDAQGELCVAIGAETTPTPLVISGNGMGAMGMSGILAVLLSGSADLISLTDAPGLFDRMAGADQGTILRAIGGKSTADAHPDDPLLRVLAVHAARQRGLKPALGVIQRALEEEGLDLDLREACEDAMASLRGEPVPLRTRAITPLADALAAVPDGVEAFLVIQSSRLPSGAPLMQLVRRAAEAQVRSMMEYLQGEEQRAEIVTDGMRNICVAANLGYLLAQRIGNARIDRMIVALRFRDGLEQQPYFFLRAEGRWDVAKIEAGLRGSGAPVTYDGADVLVTSPDGHSVRFAKGIITVSHAEFGAPGGAESAANLAERIDSQSPISMWLAETAPYPDAAGVFRIVRASMSIPFTQQEHIEIHTTWATPAGAMAVAGWSGGLGRLLAGFADRYEPLVPIAEAADGIKVTRAGQSVDFDVPLPQCDLIELFEKLIQILDR